MLNGPLRRGRLHHEHARPPVRPIGKESLGYQRRALRITRLDRVGAALRRLAGGNEDRA